jgi:hypothetical protein
MVPPETILDSSSHLELSSVLCPTTSHKPPTGKQSLHMKIEAVLSFRDSRMWLYVRQLPRYDVERTLTNNCELAMIPYPYFHLYRSSETDVSARRKGARGQSRRRFIELNRQSHLQTYQYSGIVHVFGGQPI